MKSSAIILLALAGLSFGQEYPLDHLIESQNKPTMNREQALALLNQLQGETSFANGGEAGGGSSVLPSKLDHSFSTYMRPVFNQTGGSCGSASRISYMFGYERNNFLRVSGADSNNMFPSHFTWMLTSQNSGKEDMARDNGVPNVKVYGGGNYSKIYGFSSDDGFSTAGYGWMQGYDKWYSAMSNRIERNSFIYLNTAENIQLLKYWMLNHWGDSTFAEGGVAGGGVASSGWVESTIPTGNYLAGQKILTKFGPTVDHGITWSGYDDQVCWDFNKDGALTNNKDINADGIVDVKDWECGAVILLNSWASSWGNKGTIYIPWKIMAETNRSAEFYFYRKNYKPERTFKISLGYSQRQELKLSIGISSDTNATQPELTIPMQHFINAGRSGPMLGKWADGKIHSEDMEFGYDLTDLSFGLDKRKPLKYFFIVERSGSTGSGALSKLSLLDYAGQSSAPTEKTIISSSQNINKAIQNFGIVVPGNPAAKVTELYVKANALALVKASSQSSNVASLILDGNSDSFWESKWGTNAAPFPHSLIIKTDSLRNLNGIVLVNRQNSSNGRPKQAQVYISQDTTNWGTAVFNGSLEDVSSDQVIRWNSQKAKFVKLIYLSSYGDGTTGSLAEVRLLESPTPSQTTNAVNWKSFGQFAHFDSKSLSIGIIGNGQTRAELYDLRGRLVWSHQSEVHGSTQWSLATQPQGNYQLLLKQGEKFQTLSIQVK